MDFEREQYREYDEKIAGYSDRLDDYEIEKRPKKKKKTKRRKKKNWLLRFLVLLILGFGTYYFATSEFFDVDEIVVEGNHHYTKEQVIDKSGIKMGNNLFEIDTRRMRDKLLENPYFKNVVIKRKIPKKILIKVYEREETAIVKLKRGYSVIDVDGLVLRKIESPIDLTEIKGFKAVVNKVGKPIEMLENTKFNETLKMLYAMKNSEIYFKKIIGEKVAIKAYIYDQLLCQGTPENIMSNIESGMLESTLYELYGNGIERGTIKVGKDNYCSFNPEVE